MSDNPNYGICPHCKAESPKGTTRERRLDGYTACGLCSYRCKSSRWDAADPGKCQCVPGSKASPVWDATLKTWTGDDESKRWENRVGLVEARSKFAAQVLEGRHDDLAEVAAGISELTRVRAVLAEAGYDTATPAATIATILEELRGWRAPSRKAALRDRTPPAPPYENLK